MFASANTLKSRIASMITAGYPNPEIAHALGCSRHYVAQIRAGIFSRNLVARVDMMETRISEIHSRLDTIAQLCEAIMNQPDESLIAKLREIRREAQAPPPMRSKFFKPLIRGRRKAHITSPLEWESPDDKATRTPGTPQKDTALQAKPADPGL